MKVNRKKQDTAPKDDAQEAMCKDDQRFGLCRRYFYVIFLWTQEQLLGYYLGTYHLVALLATVWPTGGASSSA